VRGDGKSISRTGVTTVADGHSTNGPRKLLQLHAVVQLRDMAVPPGNRLEGLKGRRAGQHSVRINDQWRICFRWATGAHEVEIVDYH